MIRSLIFPHLPVLVVVLPLLSAPLLFLMKKKRLSFNFASLVSFLTILVSLGLVDQVQDLGVISYQMGGWSSLIGIEYRADHLNLSFLLLLQVFGLIALRASAGSMFFSDVESSRFYAAWMLALSGFSGLLMTADIFNMFVFLEIASISSYLLTSFGKKPYAYVASFNYLMIGTVGATFILFGIGFLYLQSGILNMEALFVFSSEHPNDHTFFLGVAFVLIGLMMKAAMFPMHHWLPMVYSAAPMVVVVFFVISSTKVSAYLLMRLVNGVFFIDGHFLWLYDFWLVVASLGILIANLFAVFQKDWQKLLAYSSIGQLSYALLAMAVPGSKMLIVSVLQLLAHGVSKATVFLCLVVLYQRVQLHNLNHLGAVLRSRPILMVAWILGVLSLVGVPLTFGFTAKWSLFLHLLDQGYLWGVFVLVLGSLISLGYAYRLLEPVLFYSVHSSDSSFKDFSWQRSWTYLLLVVILINVSLGLDSDWLVKWLININLHG